MKISVLSISGMAAALMLLTTPTVGSQPEDRPRHSIIGTWNVEVTVRENGQDCTATPMVPFGPNPFPALNTFHKGGTLSETGSRSPPSRRSPGHGVWKRVGGHDFLSRYTFQQFDPNGFLALIIEFRTDIRMAGDGQSFTGVSRLELTDTSGNTQPFCATMEAVRFVL